MSKMRVVSADLGGRVREERERASLNQTDFGALGGVTRITQVYYEKGYRTPGATYLNSPRLHGVDVGYVLSGKRRDGDAMSENSEHKGLKAWAGHSYTSPGLSDDQANVQALELLRQFDGQPLPVVQQVLRRAEFWLSAVSTLDCGEATEFARAVEGLKRAAGESL